jgi:hypothetical protein
MSMPVSLHAQRGATLVVGLVMLVLITVMVTSAFKLSDTNLKSVGNMQFRDEALAAANKAIEQVLSSPFTDSPTGQSILVDINNDGTNDYEAVFDAPECIGDSDIVISAADGSSLYLGAAFAVAGSTFYQTIWDIGTTVTDAASGASIQVHQGTRVLLTQSQFNTACL